MRLQESFFKSVKPSIPECDRVKVECEHKETGEEIMMFWVWSKHVIIGHHAVVDCENKTYTQCLNEATAGCIAQR